MTTADLLALADQVEKLTGPDRLVDAEIFKALGMPLPTEFFERGISLSWDDSQQAFIMPIGEMQMRYEHPHFTASLDAAMTLVPENWRVMRIEDMLLDRWDVDLIEVHSKRSLPEGGSIFLHEEAKGHTGPLALTAACLRARAKATDESVA